MPENLRSIRARVSSLTERGSNVQRGDSRCFVHQSIQTACNQSVDLLLQTPDAVKTRDERSRRFKNLAPETFAARSRLGQG